MEIDEKLMELATENQVLRQENEQLQRHLDWLTQQVKLLRGRQFGSSSEQSKNFVGGEQLGLFDEAEAVADPAVPEPEIEQAVPKRKKRVGKRNEDFSGLPTEQIVHELPENERVCPDCGGAMHACGHEVLRRELTVIPAQYKVKEHVKVSYSCRHCEQNSDHTPMKTSQIPVPVIKNSGICSPSLLAQILYNKYVLALPLYRQETDLKRLGINLSRQTMANWMLKAHEIWFAPVFKLLHEELIQNDLLHADETRVQVLHEDGRKPKSKSYIWLYRTSGDAQRPIVLYEYQPSRAGECAATFLQGYHGYLHTDGYGAYHSKLPPGIIVVGCWAHMRRKFTDTLKSLDEDVQPQHPSAKGLAFCNKLFALEAQFDEQKLNYAQRYEARLAQSRPVADAFFAWAQQEHDKCILPDSTFGEALTYAHNQRSWLEAYFLDGRLEISNNRIERSVRPFAIGRKNWLFCNVADGATASAAVYSLVETAKANHLNPWDYLNFLLDRLPQGVNPTDCLPWSAAASATCRAV